MYNALARQAGLTEVGRDWWRVVEHRLRTSQEVAQREDPYIVQLLDSCAETDQEYTVGRDVVVACGERRGLYRKSESMGRIMWQLWVPEQLRHMCLSIHHEGSAHPGSWRMLQTT